MNTETGAVSGADFAAALGSVLGVPPPASASRWPGLYSTNLLARPQCLISVEIDDSTPASGMLASMGMPVFELQANMDPVADVWWRTQQVYGEKAVQATAVPWSQLSDKEAVALLGQLATPSVLTQLSMDYVRQLAALVLSAQHLREGAEATTLLFVLRLQVPSHASMLEVQPLAARQLLHTVLALVASSAQATCGEQALGLLVARPVSSQVELERRGSNDFPGYYGNVNGTGTKLTRVIDFCVSYTCTCNRRPDATGPDDGWLDSSTACTKECGVTKPSLTTAGCFCSWFPCPCESESAQLSLRRCSACAKGFVLIDEYCYVGQLSAVFLSSLKSRK